MSLSNIVNQNGQIPCSITTCSGGGGGGGVNSIIQGNGIIVTEPTTGNYQIINGGVVTLIEGSGIDITPGNPGEFTIAINLMEGNGIEITEGNTIANTGVLALTAGTDISITETGVGTQNFQIAYTGGGPSFPPAYAQYQSIVATQPIPAPSANTAYPINHEVTVYETNATIFTINGTTFTLVNPGVYKITSTLYNALATGADDVNNLWLYNRTTLTDVPNSNVSVYLEVREPSFSPLILNYILTTTTETEIELHFSTLGGGGRTYNPAISGVNANNTLINTIIERIA